MLSFLSRAAWLLPLFVCLSPRLSWAADWRPIDPAELAQKTPKVEPNADAEVIFWDVKIEDQLSGGDSRRILNHYVRFKIFTERGKEKYSTVEINRFGKHRISDIAGRTIKSDGTIIDLKKDSIFDRDLAKTKGFKEKGTTFALPNVEVGDIIEYRYKEYRDNELAYLPLQFQRDIPVWEVTYHLKPIRVDWLPWGMRSIGFHLQNTPFKAETQGYYFTTMTNIPAFKQEPLSPPEDSLRSWLLVYYEEDKKLVAEKYWKEIGKTDYSVIKPRVKVDDAIKRSAAELVSGSDTDMAKLQKLDAFCRNKVKNIYSDSAEMTSAERKAVKENKNPSDTLKQMAGTPTDINLLFTALASGAGFEARFARIPDRGRHFFTPELPISYFLNTYSVAVKVGEEWKFFDPSTKHLMPGTLRWEEEGQQALISDPKGGFFAPTQFSPAEASSRIRHANLKLNEEGEIEGTLEYIFTGHIAAEERRRYENETPAAIEEDWKARMGRYGSPTISDFQILQKDDATLPLVVRMKLSAQGYCARTSKRILMEPAFFEHNSTAQFPEATRKWDIYFHYAYTEDDDVTIELPEGWELDKPSAPTSSKLSDVGNYKVRLQVTSDKKKVMYSRKFSWGGKGTLVIPAQNYKGVKQVFDFVQEQDHHVLTLLKQGGASGGN